MNAKSAGALILGLATLLGAAAAQAQQAAPAAGSAAGGKVTQLSGTLVITAALDVNKGLPSGTQVTVTPFASLNGDPIYFESAGAGPTTATVAGGKLSVSVSIAYTWLVTSKTDTVGVSLGVSGGAQGTNAQLGYGSSFTATIPLPKNGVTTPVKFIGSL